MTIGATKNWVAGLAVAMLAGWLPGQAHADGATHDLRLSVETLPQTDCGSDGCVPACSVKGTLALTEAGPEKSVMVDIQFWYKSDHTDAGEGAVSLQFEELGLGQTRSTLAEAPGYACEDVKIIRIVVECPMETDSRCPGFYYVQIPEVKLLGIKKQKIEGK